MGGCFPDFRLPVVVFALPMTLPLRGVPSPKLRAVVNGCRRKGFRDSPLDVCLAIFSFRATITHGFRSVFFLFRYVSIFTFTHIRLPGSAGKPFGMKFRTDTYDDWPSPRCQILRVHITQVCVERHRYHPCTFRNK